MKDQWDFAPAVNDLLRIHDGQPPLRAPRPIPPRPIPRHITGPKPKRRRLNDLRSMGRFSRWREALRQRAA